MKCKNNHNGPLNIAGKTIRPGASVDFTEDEVKIARASNAAKIWEEQEIIEFVDDGDDAEVPLEKMTVAKLRELAAEREIEIEDGLKKADLVAAIKAADAPAAPVVPVVPGA